MTTTDTSPGFTPLPVVANVSRIVTRVVDRITGDRVDFPLLVAAACVEALKQFGIESQVMYGQAAWIEILGDQTPIWAGCWGTHISFWVATQYGEVVDLNVSVAHRKRPHDDPSLKATLSSPMLWSREVPVFYRYIPEGVAEVELTEEQDIRKFNLVLEEIRAKCRPELLDAGEDIEFPNEPMLCPNRKVLDDSQRSFEHFDRALGVKGIPKAPF